MMLFMFCSCEHKGPVQRHTHTINTWSPSSSPPHQVLEERRQLFGEHGELEEGGADLGVLPADTVVPELLHGLDVLLLIVHVG